MKGHPILLGAACWLLFIFNVPATVFYVDVNSTNPVPPYANWSTASKDIQSAVDAASNGDLIIVTNGIYQNGGRLTSDGATDLVVVTNAARIQSVNGPSVTSINGSNTMRCIYLTHGASLTGFTLTNGTAGSGGGVWCDSTNVVLSNCQLINNTAGSGGGACSGTLTNCTLAGNKCPILGGNGGGAAGSVLIACTLSANVTGTPYPNPSGSTSGGGASGCILNNCMVSGNSSYGAGASGGGAYACTLNNSTIANNYADYGSGGAYNCAMTNCTISNNQSDYSGGGVTGGILNNCMISGNNSGFGGGAYYGATLYNCTLSGNYASYGGGAEECTLVNCLLTGNNAGGYGGGAYYGTLVNCTLTGNTAQLSFGGYGGGAYNATLDNCIVYYNNGGSTGQNDYSCTLNNCCTPTATGLGNITNAPLFGAGYQLQSSSPCIDSGNNVYVTTSFDLAGNLRIADGTVDIGAYEFQTPNPLTVVIQASLTNVPVGYPVNFIGFISKGQSDSWNFGDGTVISNQLSVTHHWASVGDFPVVLTVYAPSNPSGISVTNMIYVKSQIVYYVNAASRNPVAPYDSWIRAATNLQDAIDSALPVSQSLVLVTNGVYQVGGRVAYGSLTNRVIINKTITVQSVNGPAVTTIKGNPSIGDAAVRCVYMTNNSVLAGFTLTAGATRSAGDASHENSGGAIWCESSTAVISNCVLIANSAVAEGGGICGGTLDNSTVCSNSTTFATGSGNGGGASFSVLNNCILFGNVAGSVGGGANNSTLNNCSLTGNQASESGGGVNSSALNNCTLTGNSSKIGGGANSCTMNNCINYYNSAPNGKNYSSETMNYCCTLPLSVSGVGNITNEPELTDSDHISADSPCRGVGSTNFTSGTDIDGQLWLNPPSIGCDEFYVGNANGTLSVGMQLTYTNVATGFTVNCSGTILGHAIVSVWNFGDGVTMTNQMSVSHSWFSGGTYQVVLTAYNSSNLGGVSATNIVHVSSKPIHYVSLSSTNPVSPYFSWATAATNIQDAVDAASGGAMVLVTNGVYLTGGRIVYGSLSNRVTINKAITVQSVNGPAVTIIQGYTLPGTNYGDAAVRCVYMTNNSMLSGFTLSNGATRAVGDAVLEQSGGGVFCESGSVIISNCVLTANSAADSAGGAYQGTLNNCIFTGNLAMYDGGGALQATLNGCLLSNNAASYNAGGGAEYSALVNCTLIGNSAYYAGGAYYCTLNNSLLISNNAPGSGGGVIGGSLFGCILEYNSSWWGGGANSATLNNCLLITNAAGYIGGGAVSCQLNNCTLIGNSAGTGGGANSSTLDNCIVYYNFAPSGSNYAYSTLNFCCTMPNPGGAGNITNIPLFLDLAGGDYHLQSNSPCINAGNNAYVISTNDFADNSRIVGGTVDIGAYEYQTPSSVLSYAWAQQYGLPTDGTADYADSDGDGLSNYAEWKAGTNPTNAASVLALQAPATTNTTGITVTWQSVSGVTYYLLSSTNLPVFTPIQSNLVGQAGSTSYTDTTATNGGPYFYRVGVQ